MDYTKIIKALKDDGHNVDEFTFSEKMQDPKFVEKVRSALSDIGHNVSDSSTFSKNYQNTPTLSPVDLQTTHQIESTPSTEPSYRELLSEGYNALRSVPAKLLATGYGIGTAIGTEATDPTNPNEALIDGYAKGKRVYDIAMGAPTEHKVLQTGAKILTDPINLGLATITGGGSFVPQFVKASSPVARSAIYNGLTQGAGAAGSTFLSDPNTTSTDVLASGLVGAGLGSVLGGGSTYIGSKLSQASKSAGKWLEGADYIDKFKKWIDPKNLKENLVPAVSDDIIKNYEKLADALGLKNDDKVDFIRKVVMGNEHKSVIGDIIGKTVDSEYESLRATLKNYLKNYSSKSKIDVDKLSHKELEDFVLKYVPENFLGKIKMPSTLLGAIVGASHSGPLGSLIGGLGGYVAPKIAQGTVDAVQTASPRLIPRLAQGVASVSDVVAPRVASYVPQAITQEFSTLFPDRDRYIKTRLQSAPQDNTRVQR